MQSTVGPAPQGRAMWLLKVAHMDEGGWLAGGAVDSALSRKVGLQQRKAHCRGLLWQ